MNLALKITLTIDYIIYNRYPKFRENLLKFEAIRDQRLH